MEHKIISGSVDKPKRSHAQAKQHLLKQVRGSDKSRMKRWRPIIVALVCGSVYMAISYNEVVVAQMKNFIAPGSSIATPVIVDPSDQVKVGQEARIIIPKINVDVPVVYDVKTYDESAIQAGLERGVVHYGQTALPGQNGNNVIVGHSSNNFFNAGKYKFAFVLLDRLKVGDNFILHYGGVRYIYKVSKKAIIEPTDFDLIQPTSKPVTTLITCTPPGTSWRRLVVQGEQIAPSPANAPEPQVTATPEAEIVPGNSPSFWQRVGSWLFE